MEYQFKWNTEAFLNGTLLGFVGFAGASRIQRIPMVRRPWHLVGSVLLMGTIALAFSSYQEAMNKALARQKKLYVQRLREQAAEGTPIPTDSRELYNEIVRELERKGEIVNGEVVQEVYIGTDKQA